MNSVTNLRIRTKLLLVKPPKNTARLLSRYSKIRELIINIEEKSKRNPTAIILMCDADFERVSDIYPYLRAGFIKTVGKSVFANEYRFFVGGIESYIKRVCD